jgi:cation diffusion facilitator family transporter
MAAEILVGYFSRSMALFADGWHMGTHAAALGISFLAYSIARKYAADTRFAFGTWKVEILGSYTSAIILGIVGLSMIAMSIGRLIHPESIAYNEAIIVAAIGLAVNLVCTLILATGHGHRHDHHGHEGGHQHERDLNLRSALVHVATDALTSVLAIVALAGAKYLHLTFLDPLMGIVGALLIGKWTWGLLRESSSILIDKEMDSPIVARIRETVESDGATRVSDLHVWRVAQERYACIITLARSGNATIADYKERLRDLTELVHVSIEAHRIAPLTATPDNPQS